MCVCVRERDEKGPYLQVSVVDTPAMAIINSIYKLLEISTCFIFTHPSMVYLHNKMFIRTYTTHFPCNKDGKHVLSSKAILFLSTRTTTMPMNDEDTLIIMIE